MPASGYCIYLRKSRKDYEAEEHGEGETLSRHRKILLELAKKLSLNVIQIYEEIVSGETIASRPEMQKLLSEVEQGAWAGVLVMEVERLARGDTIDQGIVAQAFKQSGTKIITPVKTYDPNNEFDEEYFEFGLFMSRREYKTINRRLQRGREAAAKEGKYIASIAPYGYEKIKAPDGKGYTLKIVPEQAEVIKLIFSLYVNGMANKQGVVQRMGLQQIVRYLNEIGIPPIRYDYWQKSTVRDIIINPVYAGKVRWGWRKVKKKTIGGEIIRERPRNFGEDCIVAKGLHEAIISEEMFDRAQKYLSEFPPAPVGRRKEVRNPLAGLIICGKCGRSMVFRRGVPQRNKLDYIVCHARACDNVSSPFKLVEERILATLKNWVEDYKISIKNQTEFNQVKNNGLKKMMEKINKEIETLKKQLNSTYDLLEQGVYTSEQFLERSRILTERIEENQNKCKELNEELKIVIAQGESRQNFIPKVIHLLDVYDSLPTAAQKNQMLKEVLEKAVYLKEKSGAFRGVSADDFSLTVYPRLPKT